MFLLCSWVHPSITITITITVTVNVTVTTTVARHCDYSGKTMDGWMDRWDWEAAVG